MRAIIDGKRYNTETAELVCDVSPDGYSYSDFRREDTELYVTKKGAFFLAGEGGPMTRWARRCGDGTSGGSGIQALDRDEARELLERHGMTKAIERLFGAEIEDA